MKKTVCITVVGILLGLILGVIGAYLYLDYLPKQKLIAAAQKQEEVMNKMVRSGQLLSVSPDEIKLKAEYSGDKLLEGQEISVKINSNTTIQEGSKVLNIPGEVFDLTKYLHPGQKVDVLEKDGQALAVYWAATTKIEQAEQPTESVQQNSNK